MIGQYAERLDADFTRFFADLTGWDGRELKLFAGNPFCLCVLERMRFMADLAGLSAAESDLVKACHAGIENNIQYGNIYQEFSSSQA